MKEREKITVFTDGSCYAKHPEKLGGSGAYILWKDKEYFISKGYKNTTIDRREIEAITLALRAIKTDVPCTVTFYVDRQNVVNTLKSKYIVWYQFGSATDIAINQDVWIELFKEIRKHKKMKMNVCWIPGHQKDKENPITLGNHIADILADYKQFTTYQDDQINS